MILPKKTNGTSIRKGLALVLSLNFAMSGTALACHVPPPPPPPKKTPPPPPAKSTPPPPSQSNNGHWQFDLAPLFYLNFDKSNILVNQTKASSAYDGALTMDDDRDGFRSIRSEALDIGAGVLGYWNFVDGASKPFLPFVGILPIAGKSAKVNQLIKDKRDISQLPTVRVPYNSHDLDSWSVNDSMMFQSTGSVLFFGGVGIIPASAQLIYSATGTWSVYVEKTDANQALVKITKLNLQSLGVSAGNVLVNADAKIFGGKDDDFSYSFDLTDSQARKAFEDFLKGNLVPTEEMSKGSASVKLVQMDEGQIAGDATHLWLGLPMIFESESGVARDYEYGISKNNQDGSTTDMNVSNYVEKRSTRSLITDHWQRTQSFTAVAYKLTSADQQVSYGQTGQLSWSDLNDNSDADHLRGALAALVRTTGISRLSLHVADIGDMGYAGVKFTMDMPEATTAQLMAMARDRASLRALSTNARRAVSTYFAAGDDKHGHCDQAWENRQKLSSKRGNEVLTCRERVEAETQGAITSMQNAMTDMANSVNDREAFVKAYREFGHAMLTNEFSFQTALSSLKANSFKTSVRIEGERIAAYERNF